MTGAHRSSLGEVKLLAVDVLPDRLMEVFFVAYLFHCALFLFHLHLEACPTPRFAKSVVEAPPEALILFSLDD